MVAEPLTVRIELRAADPPVGTVVLENTGPEPVAVWRAGNSWGDEAPAFLVEHDGKRTPVTRAPQVYTRNVPATVTLAPGERDARPFDLSDGTWEGDVPRGAATTLVAVFEVPPSPEAETQGAWTGRAQSAPVALDR